jgi:hypothetical protein
VGADITFVPIGMGFLHLAVVLDAWSPPWARSAMLTTTPVRRNIWYTQGLLTSRRNGQIVKPRPALQNALAYAICHAA